MDELLDAMDKNWEGYDELRKLAQDAPKYGNDDDYVDDIARRIGNHYYEEAHKYTDIYGKTFTVPDPYIAKVGARIRSLQDPTKKMSKSDDNTNSWVAILDKPDTIMKKFKRAVTDSDAKVCVGEGKDGINNLIGIMGAVTGKTADALLSQKKSPSVPLTRQ